jgi:hypothetical protein
MEEMRVHQRWMPLPWGAFGIALALIFAGIGVDSLIMHPEEQPSVRVVIPMYALALYWVFALLCNKRTATITPEGVRVSVWPFLVRLPRRVKHGNIRHCYIRQVDVYDEGTVLERHYSAGVETLDGEQIDISKPHNTAEEAMLLANQVARVLNRWPGRSPVEVRQVAQIPERKEVLLILALASLWLALFIAAIFIGFAWEEERVRSRRTAIASPQLKFAACVEHSHQLVVRARRTAPAGRSSQN